MNVMYPARFHISDYIRTHFVAVAEQGTTRDELKSPEFWKNIAPKVKVWDKIDVLSDDGTFYAEYLVMSCGRAWVKVREMLYINLTTSDVSATQAEAQDGVVQADSKEGHVVAWKGPINKWSIIRNSDKEYIKKGFDSEADATTALNEYLKAVV